MTQLLKIFFYLISNKNNNFFHILMETAKIINKIILLTNNKIKKINIIQKLILSINLMKNLIK